MSDGRIPLAFGATQDIRHCEERDSATKQSPAGDAPLPAGDCFASLAMTVNGLDPRHIALILTGNGIATGSFALVRHADGAARAQAGACSCCRVPSDLVTVLRQLVIDRARGEIDFAAAFVAGEPATLARLEQDALADPLVAARYVVRREH